MNEPIEGRYRVLGDNPPYEPVIKDWRGLWLFVGLTVLAMVLNTARIMSESRLWDGGGDASRGAPAEQSPARPNPVEHLTQ